MRHVSCAFSRGTDAVEHRVFRELPMLLQAGDLLVINNSKVLPARHRS